MSGANEQTESARLSIGVGPHIREGEDIARIMWTVNLALAPIGVGALFLFGWYAGLVIATSVGACMAFEAIWQKLSGKRVTVGDGSAVITGMLLAFVLPPNVPLFVVVMASGVAMIIAKHLFGRLGYNIWNPALVGRAFVQIAYPALVTPPAWPIVTGSGFGRILQDVRNAAPAGGAGQGVDAVSMAMQVGAPAGASPQTFDAISMATPLGWPALQTFVPTAEGTVHPMYGSLKALFVGNVPGCIGETSALLILVGGALLIYRGHINWKVPAVFLGTLFVFAFVFPTWKITGAEWFSGLPRYETGLGAPERFFFPTYQILAGGAMLGAFFMATDMVTTPETPRGQVIFAFGCGAITGAIRLLGHGFPEGCCYSILLMNTATPMIDRYTRPTKYGAAR